jgi:hypothetical protein
MASNGQTNWDKESTSSSSATVRREACRQSPPTMPRWSGCVLINRYSDSANSAVVRKNPQDFSRVVYKMMLESRARARLSKNKAGMKRTG